MGFEIALRWVGELSLPSQPSMTAGLITPGDTRLQEQTYPDWLPFLPVLA